MNKPKSRRRLLFLLTILLAVAAFVFLAWHITIGRMGGSGEFTPYSFNWGVSGQETVVPGFDQGAVEILADGEKVAFVICVDFQGVDPYDDAKKRSSGYLKSSDRTRTMRWESKTSDGKTGRVVVNGESFNLRNGSLFLVSTHGGPQRIRQFDKDLSFMKPKPPYTEFYGAVTDFLRSDPDVTQFFNVPPRPATPIYFITLGLPRGKRTADGKWSPTHDEIFKAIKDLKCFARGYFNLKTKSITASNHNSIDYETHQDLSFSFAPTAESDLGDVAKALAKLGGDKSKPVATFSLAKETPIAGASVKEADAKFAVLKKELSDAKGIEWEKSSRIGGLALDEAGGAMYLEILAAYKKAGIAVVGE